MADEERRVLILRMRMGMKAVRIPMGWHVPRWQMYAASAQVVNIRTHEDRTHRYGGSDGILFSD